MHVFGRVYGDCGLISIYFLITRLYLPPEWIPYNVFSINNSVFFKNNIKPFKHSTLDNIITSTNITLKKKPHNNVWNNKRLFYLKIVCINYKNRLMGIQN